MKLILKNRQVALDEARRNKEVNIGKVFSYDEKFLNSLKRKGLTTFIRFSNDLPGGNLMLTPNFSDYRYGTPIGIYGYPLDSVKERLKDQSLGFSDYKTIIVYWVRSDTIVDLSSIKKADLIDLVDQTISYGGKEKYIEALQRWKKKSSASHRDVKGRLQKSERLVDTILYANGSVASIVDQDAPIVFTGIIDNYGDKSSSKTLLLKNLTLKQKDNEGNIVNKKFSTILDNQSLIDPTKEGFNVQALTISSKNIEDYEFYENPARKPARTKDQKQDKYIVAAKNPERFEQVKDSYLTQLPEYVKHTLDKNVQFKQISGGVQIDLKLPGKKGLLQDTINKKKIEDPEFREAVGYDIQQYISKRNGEAGYESKLKTEFNFARPGMQPNQTGDIYSIIIYYPEEIISAQSVFATVYFMYSLYTKEKGSKSLNPFFSEDEYKKILTNAAGYFLRKK